MTGEQRARMAPPARLRGDGDGEDLRFVDARCATGRSPTGCAVARGTARRPRRRAQPAAARIRACSRAARRPWHGWRPAARAASVPSGAMRAEGGRTEPVEKAHSPWRFGPRPAAWRRARAGRAAWAGPEPDRRWRRGAPPRRCRAPATSLDDAPRPLAPGLRPPAMAAAEPAMTIGPGAEQPDGLAIAS